MKKAEEVKTAEKAIPKQKKPAGKLKKVRIILAVLTFICLAYTSFAIYTVWGEKLLYYDSAMGAILSVSFKWALLALVFLVIVNVLLALASKRATRF